MKKLVFVISFIVLFGFIFGLSATDAKAQTVAELQAEIQQLMAQIAELQAKLSQLRPEPLTWCHNFNVNLRVGDRGSEVNALVIALTKEGFIAAEERGLHDMYEFNEGIASAVVGFQEKYASEVLAPWRLTRGTGYVGPSTRAKLNKLYGCEGKEVCVQKGSTCCLGEECVVLTIDCIEPLFSVFKGCNANCHPQWECLPSTSSITVISPNGGEEWLEGKNHVIYWEQRGLEKWGNRVKICLIGFDSFGKPIAVRGDRQNSACAYAESSQGLASYLITETTLTNGKYNWEISNDILKTFEKVPVNYKVSILVFDELPQFQKTEWAGLIDQAESNNYFSIVSELKEELCGDVNANGRIDIGDVVLLRNHIAYSQQYPVSSKWAADVNCDGAINILDIVLLQNYVGYPGKYQLRCCGLSCQNLWWHDNNHQYCQQKQFCDAYMYPGLSTFQTKEECEASLKKISINIFSPKGEEKLIRGRTYEIKWEAGGVNAVNIELLNSVHRAYSEKIAVNHLNAGSYRWSVPLDSQNIHPKHNYIISISDSYGLSEARSAEFSIISAPALVLCDNYGDVNYDGHVSSVDVSFITDYMAGLRNFNEEQKLRADINQDGQINILDTTIINQYLDGKITVVPACQKTSPCGNYGDLTGSGFVNLRDVKLINDCILGMSSCTAEHRRRADVNNDGRVDILDATLVNRYISSLDSTFPVCKLSSITITFPREGQEIKSGAYGRIDWNISGGESGQTIYVDRKMPGEDWRRISGPLQHDVTAFFWQAPYVDIPTNVGIRVGLWSKEGNLLVSDIVTVRVMPETPIITLEKGWNLFSPSVEEGITISAMRSEGCSIEAVYSWNPVTRGYNWFSGSSYRLEPDKGYWVAVLENCNFSLPGTPWYFSRTSYNAGTHLIGSAYETIEVADVLGTCHLGKTKVKTQLNFYNGTYQEVSTMLPFKAYWLELEESCFFGTKPPEQMILTSTEY